MPIVVLALRARVLAPVIVLAMVLGIGAGIATASPARAESTAGGKAHGLLRSKRGS